MSFYVAAEGSIHYSNVEDFEKAKNILMKENWVNEQGTWIMADGEESSARAFFDSEMMILFPRMDYRNITYVESELTAGGIADVKWTSVDGKFAGGFFGGDFEVDLEEWAKQVGIKKAPQRSEFEDEDEYYFEYFGWQIKIQMHFLDTAKISDFLE